MSYLDDFNARMNIAGNTVGQAQFNTTADYINATFADSPFYKVVKYNGQDLEIRLLDIPSVTRSNSIQLIEYQLKFIQLRPSTSLNIGSMLVIDGVQWMVTDYMVENPLFPKAKIEQCNYLLQVVTGQTKTLIGYDSLKRPQYSVQPITNNVDVILRNTVPNVNLNQTINLPNDTLYVSMEYHATAQAIKLSDVFEIYNQQYRVTGMDHTAINYGVGIITFITERVVNS